MYKGVYLLMSSTASLQILMASQWGTTSGRFNTGKNRNISDNITFTLLILLNYTGKTSSMTVLRPPHWERSVAGIIMARHSIWISNIPF